MNEAVLTELELLRGIFVEEGSLLIRGEGEKGEENLPTELLEISIFCRPRTADRPEEELVHARLQLGLDKVEGEGWGRREEEEGGREGGREEGREGGRRNHGRGNFRTFHTRDFAKARSGGTLTSQPIYPKRKHNTNTKVPSIKASAVAPADMASNFSTESEMERSPAKLGLKEEEYDRLVHVHAFRQRHLRTMTGIHPPLPLCDEWTPRPARPVQSLRPWNAQDSLPFRLHTYLWTGSGGLTRLDHAHPRRASDAPPPSVSKRLFQEEVSTCRLVIARRNFQSIHGPLPAREGGREGGREGKEEKEEDTFSLDVLAGKERDKTNLEALAALQARGREGGREGGRPAVRTDSMSIYAYT
ncbi:hypothetical protein NSK_008457 [Nannochloropsis salina CCMP1776]|uniref:Uncharacterized protein n=1 Tax=Nannochloropsis salina CCMP1776 TaxID=1027361 RepID=A0A4D9CP77_9STRA|nr:hypothetical protein NSK_008457 [Nannochloropsis salina CCMP1776]|eukprot:TFJ80314.1 hypothetical protein NSK_008457 [Nannochloropsis salina CCMP1776]